MLARYMLGRMHRVEFVLAGLTALGRQSVGNPLEDHNKSIQQTRTHARARWERGGISVRDHGSSTLVR